MKLSARKIEHPLKKPFIITGHIFQSADVIEVQLSDNGFIGRGEALGTYYLHETPDSMLKDLESIIDQIDSNLSHAKIQRLLPACGARNALDCALWDLKCKQQQQSIWQYLNLQPNRLTTVFTLGIDEPEEMAEMAEQASNYQKLKVKLDADRPIEKLEQIRHKRPDADLIIDVNQGWTFSELKEYAPHCKRLGVSLLEQPLPRGQDDELIGYDCPVFIGADESCLHIGEFDLIPHKYQVLNIKLDKCGGLSEALRLVSKAQQHNMQLMIGNMTGTSLSMAPAYVIGQYCQFIDIDGPLLLKQDLEFGLNYQQGGLVGLPTSDLWG